MKKLRLKALSLGAREVLSREQLKSIGGGTGSGSGGGPWCANEGPWCCFCDHMISPPTWACNGTWDNSPTDDPDCIALKNYYCGADSWGCSYTGF